MTSCYICKEEIEYPEWEETSIGFPTYWHRCKKCSKYYWDDECPPDTVSRRDDTGTAIQTYILGKRREDREGEEEERK